MRLFVSVDLPPALTDAVAAAQAPLEGAPGVRTTDPTQAHVTLSFLGSVETDRRPAVEHAIADAVAGAEIDPFEVRFAGLGVFPSLEYVRVVWVGVEAGGGPLETLHRRVEGALEPLGVTPDDDPFVPHVTIARVDDGRSTDRIRRLIEERAPEVGAMRVSEIRLTESRRTADGPTYRTVRAFPLEG